jgi:hypothetical protein
MFLRDLRVVSVCSSIQQLIGSINFTVGSQLASNRRAISTTPLLIMFRLFEPSAQHNNIAQHNNTTHSCTMFASLVSALPPSSSDDDNDAPPAKSTGTSRATSGDVFQKSATPSEGGSESRIASSSRSKGDMNSVPVPTGRTPVRSRSKNTSKPPVW